MISSGAEIPGEIILSSCEVDLGITDRDFSTLGHLNSIRKLCLNRKRPLVLSITHIVSGKEEAEVDIGEAGQASPDDHVAWRRIA